MPELISPPWLPILIQGGSFALLAFIVVVLYPKATKESREERRERDAAFMAALEMLGRRDKDRSDEVFRENKARNQEIVRAINLQTGVLKGAIQQAACRQPNGGPNVQ